MMFRLCSKGQSPFSHLQCCITKAAQHVLQLDPTYNRRYKKQGGKSTLRSRSGDCLWEDSEWEEYRGGCLGGGRSGGVVTLCNLVLAVLTSEVCENASSSILKIHALFLIGLNVGIRPNFNSSLRELN